jgi:energy-coupling factor transporter ATP-binding protein EcfA2
MMQGQLPPVIPSAVNLPDVVASGIEQFTGRSWVLPLLLRWLDESSDRFFILTGAPGTGKSTLMAWLAGWGPPPTNRRAKAQLERLRARAGAVHFCRADSGNVAPRAFAEAMSDQLTRKITGFGDAMVTTLHDLVRIQVDIHTGQVREGASVTGVCIERLDLSTLAEEVSFDRAFRDPLRKLYETGYSEPMLLLVDALDEAQAYTGTTTLLRLLTRLGDLPSPVRVLVTTRPDPRVLTFFRRIKPVDLIVDAPAKVDDVRRYVEQRLTGATHPPDAKRYTDLAKQISAAARGNFLYAYFVLNELLDGLADVPEMLRLPEDLGDLYHEFLLREVAPDDVRWDELYRPLLGLLAVAEEPGLTQTLLERITGKEVERALRACRQFLSGDRSEGPFRPFHRSFIDFLLTDDNNTDYHIAANQAHRLIADYYWRSYAGDWTSCDDYGLRHLAAHLELAGRADQLHDLLEQGRRTGDEWANAWYTAKVTGSRLGGYVTDVERGWRLAANAAAVHRQTRYALYLSSLRATNVRLPARLLELCLQEQLLTWQEALDSTRLQQDPVARVRALARLFPSLPPEERERVVEAEYAVAAGLDDDEQRGAAFLELAAVLPDRLIGNLLGRTEALDDDGHRAGIVAAVAAHLPERYSDTAGHIARSVADPASRARSLMALASRPGASRNEDLLAEARTVIARMEPTPAKVTALCELSRLEPERREEAIDQAFALLGELDYSDGLAPAIAALARLGAPTVSAERVAETLELAERTYREEDHAGTEEAYVATLVALGPLLSEEQRASSIGPLVAERQAAASWFAEMGERDHVPLLAPFVPRDQRAAVYATYLRPLVEAAGHVGSRPSLVGLFVDLVVGSQSLLMLGNWLQPAALDALSQMPRQLLDRALEAADDVRADEGRAHVLATLVPRLPQERRRSILRRELSRVRSIGDEAAQSRALAALVPHLPRDLHTELADSVPEPSQALDATRAIDDPLQRALVLAELVPTLPEAILPEAVEMARSLGDDAYLALTPLVPRLPVEQRQQTIRQVLDSVQDENFVELPGRFVHVLRGVVSELDDDQVTAALARTKEIPWGHEPLRADALAILAPRLGGRERDRALAIARGLHGLPYVRAMASLAPLLPERRRTAALRKAQATARRLIGQDGVRALTALTPLLPDRRAALAEALEAAMAITEDDHRAYALVDLLPHLTGAERARAYDRLLRSCLGVRIVMTIGGSHIREDIGRAFLLDRIAASADVLASMGSDHLVS